MKEPRSYGRVSKHRDLSNRVYASDYARAEATEKAEELDSGLGTHNPTFVKPMLQSHVSGGFWLVKESIFMCIMSLATVCLIWYDIVRIKPHMFWYSSLLTMCF